MAREPLTLFTVRRSVAFIVSAGIVVALLQWCCYDMNAPELDARRYVDYALNIHDHGVFGLSDKQRDVVPQPGNANSPLYPALVALVLNFDRDLVASLRCEMSTPTSSCQTSYRAIVVAQNTLVVAALCFVWATAILLFRNTALAWLAAGLSLISTKPMFFANTFLTEILVLCLFAALMLGLTAALISTRRRWWAFVGAVVGLLTLTRPEYLYLGYCLIALGAAAALIKRSRETAIAALLFTVTLAVILAPWLARNYKHFANVSITEGYSDVIIAYRTAYNRMSFDEWRAAFVYWLPAHGETLAKQLFAKSAYAKLGADLHSYLYTDGKAIFDQGLEAVGGDRDRLTSYLLKTEVFAHPFKHTYASIPLAWRGILAGKYLAVIGVPSLLFLTIIAITRRNKPVLILLVPAVIMVALYAAVSVSVPRYNVYLIYYYAIAVAWALISIGNRRLLE